MRCRWDSKIFVGPTQGDFLHMPFGDGTFDGAYAIEATCHAAKVSWVPSCDVL